MPPEYYEMVNAALNVVQTVALAYIAQRWRDTPRNGSGHEDGSDSGEPSARG